MIHKNVQPGIQVQLIPVFTAALKGLEMNCVKGEGKK
jgi:hypothetical protein